MAVGPVGYERLQKRILVLRTLKLLRGSWILPCGALSHWCSWKLGVWERGCVLEFGF